MNRLSRKAGARTSNERAAEQAAHSQERPAQAASRITPIDAASPAKAHITRSPRFPVRFTEIAADRAW